MRENAAAAPLAARPGNSTLHTAWPFGHGLNNSIASQRCLKNRGMNLVEIPTIWESDQRKLNGIAVKRFVPN